MAVATGQVLRGDDRNSISGFALDEKNFRMIVGKIGALDNLGDERPEFERLVGRLVSRTRFIRDTFLSLVMKKSRRRNSSEIENEVCQTSAMPTWLKIHSRMSATWTAFER